MDILWWNCLFLLALIGIGTAWDVIDETLWGVDFEDLD